MTRAPAPPSPRGQCTRVRRADNTSEPVLRGGCQQLWLPGAFAALPSQGVPARIGKFRASALVAMAMLLCLCSLTAAAALPAPAAAVVTPIDIANSTQLFVDDFLVASKTANLVRSLHRPDCSRVAVTTDAPWERNYTMGLIGTNVILREDGTLQLTYSLRNSTLGCRPASVKPSANDQPPCSEISPTNPPQPNYEATAGNIYIGYAESTDGGLTFQKPLQHKYSVRGSTANNFIAIASPGSNGLSIFIDPNEQPGSPKRYRGTSADLALISPDGKNWTKIGRMVPPSTIPAGSDEGMPGHGAFDTDGIIYWDPVCGGGGGCYSFFTRWDRAKPGAAPTSSSSGLGRAVRRADSKHLDSLLNTTCNGTHDWNPVMCPIGKWENESVVMGADKIDLSTHPLAPGSGQFVPMVRPPIRPAGPRPLLPLLPVLASAVLTYSPLCCVAGLLRKHTLVPAARCGPRYLLDGGGSVLALGNGDHRHLRHRSGELSRRP